jgi:oligopeptidase B
MSTSLSTGQHPAPPTRRAVSHPRQLHGTTWDDPFAWLQTPQVLERLLNEERAHADAVLAPVAQAAEELVAAAGRQVMDVELGIAQRRGARWYVVTIPEGARYPQIHAAQAAEMGWLGLRIPTAEEVAKHGRILVDLATLIGDVRVSLGTVQVSPCGRWIAWTQDPTGAERFSVHVAPSGADSPEQARELARDSSPTITFDAAGDHVFVVRMDDRNRPATLWRYPVSGAGDAHVLLHEPDPTRRIRVERTLSDAFLVVTRASRDESTCAVLSCDDADGPLHEVDAGRGAITVAHAELNGSAHLLVTCANAGGQESWLAPIVDGGPAPRDTWHSVLRFGPDEAVSPPMVLRDHVVVGRKVSGRDELLVGTWQTLEAPYLDLRPVRLPDVLGIRIVAQPEWADTHLVVSPTSYVHPPAAYRVDLAAGGDAPLLVSGDGETATLYSEQVVHARPADGPEIPITLVRSNAQTGPAPVYIIGYGAYGVVSPPAYNPMLRFLLDRGFAFAFAHVRGGGELGRQWHEDARGTTKERSIDDFIACVDHLVEIGVADPERVVAGGGSAGALLVGAAINRSPERFCAAVLDVPFLDPLTSMLDPSQPLTVSDRLEWGDPLADAEAFEAIRSYAPYSNVRSGVVYPRALVTVRREDKRVTAVEAAKWVQRVRHETSASDVVLRVLDGGHTGSGFWLDNIRKLAEDYVWIDRVAGTTPLPSRA